MAVSLAWMWMVAGASVAGLAGAEGSLEPGRTATVLTIPAPEAARTVALVIALEQPGALAPAAPLSATVNIGGTTLSKDLHLGDPDVTWLVRQPVGAALRVALDAAKVERGPLPYTITATEVGEDQGDAVTFEAEPNDRYQDANPITLGQTLYGLADDRPYLPIGDVPTPAEASAGQDWFTFEFASETPKLGYFALEFVDKDVPPDVRLFVVHDGTLVEYTQGIDPQSSQRERPPRPGANKFTTRVLKKGRYYVHVDACQPEYQLRTKLFDVPPYLTAETRPKGDARRAVRGHRQGGPRGNGLPASGRR